MRAWKSDRNVRWGVSVRLVAAGVVLVAGLVTACGGTEGEPAELPTDVDTSIVATDSFAFEPSEVEVQAGTIEIGMLCEQSLPHDIVVETEAEDVKVVECGGGEAATGTVELDPGEYTFFCSITGHREAGMEGTLTVE